jgi:hypothetical protein
MRRLQRPGPWACALIFLAGAGSTALADTVVTRWDAAALQAVRDTHPSPTVVARALGVLHTCMFDAWAAYDGKALGTRLGGTLRRPRAERTLGNKAKAISVAAYLALADLFPTETPLFDALMNDLGYDPADGSTPSLVGHAAADAVLAFRHRDGANQLGDLHPGAYSDYTGYAPVNTPDQILDPNRWQPLRVPDGHGGFVIQRFATPHWGRVIPFALASGAQFRPPAPATFPSFEYRDQALDLLRLSGRLTDRQKVIAEYWADGPSSELPPGHWCLFGKFVCDRDGLGLDDEVKLFFALGNALMDASIAAWDAKRAYDSVRPVSAIHFLFAGRPVLSWAGPYQGNGWVDGANWQPYQPLTVVTPPFAEFISGHSTFSAAAAEVLRRSTGRDYFGSSVIVREGTSKVEPGATPATDVTLSWATFSEAADQAGLSRRYGGIHFEKGDLVGRSLGRRVGAEAWRKAQSYIDGMARGDRDGGEGDAGR